MSGIKGIVVIVALIGMTNAGILNWNAIAKFLGNAAQYILSGAGTAEEYKSPQYRPTPSPNGSLASDRERL